MQIKSKDGETQQINNRIAKEENKIIESTNDHIPNYNQAVDMLIQKPSQPPVRPPDAPYDPNAEDLNKKIASL